MSNEAEKRTAYEATVNGLVAAVHNLVVAFETMALASAEWDPKDEQHGADPVAHAAIRSCSAMVTAIIDRYPGAAQLLGIDQIAARLVARAALMAAPSSASA